MVPHVTTAGWLVVPYDGYDLSKVEIGVRVYADTEWKPAYLDYCEGVRVAQVRPPLLPEPRRADVWLRVDGVEQHLGQHLLGIPPS